MYSVTYNCNNVHSQIYLDLTGMFLVDVGGFNFAFLFFCNLGRKEE